MKLTAEVLKDLGCYPNSHSNPVTWYMGVGGTTFEITPYNDKHGLCKVQVTKEKSYAEMTTVEELILHIHGWGRTLEREEMQCEVKTFLNDTLGIKVD